MSKEALSHKRVIAALESSAGIVSAAAIKLGVTARTVRNYVARHEAIAEALDQIKQDNLDLAETKLLTNLRDGNMTAIIFYLKTQGRDRGYNEKLDLGGSLGVQTGVVERVPTQDADDWETQASAA